MPNMQITNLIWPICCLLYLLGLAGCDRPQPFDVHPDFQPYVDRFIAEGAKRGHDIDFSDTGLSIIFREAVDTETGGVCRGKHRIEIEKFFWDDLNDFQREGLIFHELGHCELGRGHKNDTLPNGEWASRMRGDPIPQGLSAVINYTGARRLYYIDELFDPGTPQPDWATFSADYHAFGPADKSLIREISGERRSFQTTINLPSSANFEVEFELDIGLTESWAGVQWGGNEFDNSIRLLHTATKRFLIDSGNQVWGTMREIKHFGKIRPGFNKWTIRKLDDQYHIFLNEEFIYWFDYQVPAGNMLQSIVAGTTSPTFRDVRIYRL
ncbi:MAG: hypothetical protein D6730_20520 [Bacteroidetes bacterium]|nr:MAG: hypothetical protein D6730_20520 [Bacteroidota bacterium]